jgi:hypothetical protein
VAGDCSDVRLYLVEAAGQGLVGLPNGALVLSTGTLLRAENEAQLAHLLAHEIAHYRHKDSLVQFRRRLDTSGVVALLGVAASGAGLAFVGTPASMAALDARYANSESQEAAADRDGVARASAAGYDAAEAAAVWRNADPEYLKLHPGAHPTGAAPHLPGSQGRHQAAVAPFLDRWVSDELKQGGSVALFTRLSASGGAVYRYALGEAYRKRGAPGDAGLAEAAFRAALAAPDAPPLAWRGLGLVAMQEGDKARARSAFLQYRTALPDADDKAMIDYYLEQP